MILIKNLTGGGAERQVSLLSNATQIEKVILFEPERRYSVPDNKLVVLSPTKPTGIARFVAWLRLPFQIKPFVDRNTHLLCFLPQAYLLGWACKILYSCRFTICVRTDLYTLYQSHRAHKLIYRLFKIVFNAADDITANSAQMAKGLKKNFGVKKCTVIENGFDIDGIKRMAEEPLPILNQLFEQYKVLINVGRLSPEKGQAFLLHVFRQVLISNPQTKLVLLGQGGSLEQLKSLCYNLGLRVFDITEQGPEISANAFDVYFIGFQSNPFQFVQRSFLFVQTSMVEGFPNVLVESLIVGTPCIASDCESGPREILVPQLANDEKSVIAIQSDFGYLMPPITTPVEGLFEESELAEWTKVLVALLENEALRATMKLAADRQISRFGLDNMLLQWKQFLD